MSGQAHSVVFVSRNRQHDVFKTVCSTCSGQVYSVFFVLVCVCVCVCVCVKVDSMTYLTLCVARAVVRFILCFFCV